MIAIYRNEDGLEFRIDTVNCEVLELTQNRYVNLRPQVAQLLFTLVENKRHYMSFEAICITIWPEDGVLDYYRKQGIKDIVYALRRSLGSTIIQIKPRMGYMLNKEKFTFMDEENKEDHLEDNKVSEEFRQHLIHLIEEHNKIMQEIIALLGAQA